MNILRLSLFKLKKNKKEAVAIVFLTMITTLMLSVFAANISKANKAYDDSFAQAGSKDTCVMIRKDKFRDEYKDLLNSEYGIREITETECVYGFTLDYKTNNGDERTYVSVFVSEKNERKIEDFVKTDKLTDEEVEKLEHPIWLPMFFSIGEGVQAGDTLTVCKNGRDYPFTVAGFYKTGLYNDSAYGYKMVISDNDYELFKLILDDGVYGAYTTLWFNSANTGYNEDIFIESCEKLSGEELNSYSTHNSTRNEKSNSLQFINMFMYFLAFFSGITMLSAVLMIIHRITNDIEDQMQQIGVLEALGYRSREISLSYVYEYVITAGIGAVLGAVGAFLVSPLMNLGIQIMIGRPVTVKTEGGMILLSGFIVVVLVTVFSLLKAAKVKKYPPVVAFRKGIRTHHFGRNILPLEKTKGNINIALAMKSFLCDIKSAVGTAVCIIAAGTAILFCVTSAEFFGHGIDGLLSMTGDDIVTEVELLNGVDTYAVRDEIAEMPEVRKALVNYQQKWLSVRDSEYPGATVVFDNYNDAENIKLIDGRFPEHDNEVMTTIARKQYDGVDIGDSIVIKGNGTETKFIVTGMTSSMMNSGTMLYMTSEGYCRACPDARPNIVSVYLKDGVTMEQFEEKLNEKLGTSAKDSVNAGGADGTLEERIRAAADEKLALLTSQYGVTNIDYAVVVDGQVITGNSRHFIVKDVSSLMSLAEQSMSGVATVSKYGSVGAMLVLSAVVAVILGLIASSNVKRQRRRLGIMKGMGYTSKDLMKQIAIKTMPVTIVSVITASFAAKYVYSAFWLMVFGTVGELNIPLTIVADVILVAFCYAVTYISAGRIKAISVTELMTE
ncbi:ABC transporter permease [Ruminococcus sp.]|uniref:ABC transporter permease n=1 Tax=Ruminococcus sp. TaxID=41978 RepID=UPI001B2AF95A|nr:ABC transporter permease [Ruminococcus sp.]MBO5557338.1 ABC transporter permease [Ruminococcus sp.]